MDETLKPPENTQEFLAMWNVVTADHLVHKLTTVLQDLGRRLPQPVVLDQPSATALATQLVHAFQVAASPQGGAHAAVQLLTELAAGTPDPP